ncbi:hypothetical protein HQ945_01550 [Phyllobacterium sp. BT25]|jgi:ElaB/YqjD/DUF883 family membrane-anchored ribosome-binding protein|uniref:DUF3618 domain-containing protein n=1 Tax=Phyllobacterium pellucidum TaxID=2740464 RepID=A0A849VKV6_9HYPH|nr:MULTISPECIES: hypothetical protein [Phyllobacterium]NTS29926.1 hypothetical protein [Phyllobacterium pellucidum]UGY08263.1 hypothetical protein LLE51_009295 [Phyllobacterium sp. T1018]SFI47614.1 hypothetical protein SAMN04515648_0029 [Phyllobacterium sp. CL33Tsu]
MAMFSKNADDIQGDVEAQIAALRKEISKISASLPDLTSERFDEVKRIATKQAKHAAATARENPVATIAILAGAAVLVGLLARR